MDQLEEIFQAQRKLQKRLGHDFALMNQQDRVDYVKENVLALTDELHEALAECKGWKSWTTGERAIHRDPYLGELIDALHFLMNLFIVIGADTNEITQRYLGKNKINHDRQDQGYTGEKCAQCHGELDRLGRIVFHIPNRSESFDSYECRSRWIEEHAGS